MFNRKMFYFYSLFNSNRNKDLKGLHITLLLKYKNLFIIDWKSRSTNCTNTGKVVIYVVFFWATAKETATNGGHCAKRAVDSIISGAKLPGLYWHFPSVCSPSHFVTSDVIWRATKLPKGWENTCLCPMRLSLYKVSEFDLLRYKIGTPGIMKIKLTGNSFTNETDIRTNHLLSKMLPIVI